MTAVETIEMPRNLPYPQSPNYHCGTYGIWSLEEKPQASFERGYFTGYDAEPPGHYLVCGEDDVWMSTSRLERESHAVHLKYARGNVVVCGVGMGMYLFNIASLPGVDRIVAIDLDVNIINLAQHATDFDSWVGQEKIKFVNRNALQLQPSDIGMDVDFLYVDIWPELGGGKALAHTQLIQSVVKAKKVGWWGQEIDFIDWLGARKANEDLGEQLPDEHLPDVADFKDFIREINLPIEEPTPEYIHGCRQAWQLFETYRASLT